MRVVDLAGTRNGDIEFIERVGSAGGYSLWRCKCLRCGKEFTLPYSKIFHGHPSKYPENDKSLKCCLDCRDAVSGKRSQRRGPVASDVGFGVVSVCKQCGKQFGTLFYKMDEYVYRRGSNVFCSYHCMREFDKARESKKK